MSTTRKLIRYHANNLSKAIADTWTALREINAPIFIAGDTLRIQDHGALKKPTREDLQFYLRDWGIDYEVSINGEWVRVDVAPYAIVQALLKP